LDGYKICSRLKANISTRNTPILLISSQATECDKRGFIAGADDFINILIQPFIIKARVDHYMELKRCRDLLENPRPIDRMMNVTDRSQLTDHATREWRRAIRHQTPLSLIILEIDSFKAYTDYYGHLAGDDCLAQIDRFLLKNMRREPDLVARYKGNEYVCLLPETDACGAIKVANSIQEAMEELNVPFSCSQETDHVTMSFGVVTIRPASRLKPGFLLHQAELILSEAKRAGHNQIRCWQDC
jgi:diguanylate cyclase (GGDEF)-like protein